MTESKGKRERKIAQEAIRQLEKQREPATNIGVDVDATIKNLKRQMTQTKKTKPKQELEGKIEEILKLKGYYSLEAERVIKLTKKWAESRMEGITKFMGKLSIVEEWQKDQLLVLFQQTINKKVRKAFLEIMEDSVGSKYRISKWGGYTHKEKIGRALNENYCRGYNRAKSEIKEKIKQELDKLGGGER